MEDDFGPTAIPEPLRKLLVCCVCQVGFVQEMVDPVILPCLHSICTKCLKSRSSQNDQKDSIRCPVCVTSCQVPAAGIEAFPRDTFYDVLRKSITRPYDETPKAVPLCRLHKKKAMNLYCDTCLLPVCQTCWQDHHESHQVNEVEDKVENFDHEIRHSLSPQMEMSISEASDNLENVKVNRNKMASDLKETRMRIRNEARRLRDEIARKEESHLRQLDQVERDTMPLLDEIQETYEALLANLQALKTYTDTLVSKGSEYDKVCHMGGVKKQFKKETGIQVESFTWESTMPAREDGETEERASLLGELSITDLVRSPALDTAEELIAEGPDLENSTIVLTECQNHVGLNQVHFPDFCPLFGQLCIIHIHRDSNRFEKICIHDEAGTVRKQLAVPGVKSYGRSTVQDPQKGQIIVTDHRQYNSFDTHVAGAFHWLTFSPDFELVSHSVSHLQCSPCMSSVGPSGEVILTAHCPIGAHPPSLMDVDKDGTLIRSIPLPADIFECPLSAQRTENGYVIGDTLHDYVVWINYDGEVLRSFSQDNLKPFVFTFHPVGVLLVPDWGGHKIHMLGREKHFHVEVLRSSDGLRFPRRVYMDHKAGKLYVAVSQHGDTWQVKRYRFNVRAHQPVRRHLKMSFKL